MSTPLLTEIRSQREEYGRPGTRASGEFRKFRRIGPASQIARGHVCDGVLKMKQRIKRIRFSSKAQFPESGVTVDYLLAIFINSESA